MIIIKLQGGLGNQMFQYALASILAKNNKETVLIDNSFFDLTEKKLGHTPRKFELDVFENPYAYALSTDIFFFKRLSIFNKMKKKLGFNYPKIYDETYYGFYRKVLLTKSPVYLRGYFQSYKYFIGYENFIKGLFSFPIDKLDSINKQMLIAIRGANTIGIHIRRGDYVNDKFTQQFHGNCSLDYYVRAISLLTMKNIDFTLFFFSDDSDWVKDQFLDLPYPKQFISHNKDKDSWKDMLLMSSCSHNIIANSSFSWWAAWLNANPEKTVIAPKEWFKAKDIENTTLLPEEWIKI
ncbi:MAG: alpha-1,2-fucosyltransferase [Flavobacterium sp.]|nr:alpha-1,2-fucosyltransferase [Flavobacterium sp.]